jgi:hypothetical protein
MDMNEQARLVEKIWDIPVHTLSEHWTGTPDRQKESVEKDKKQIAAAQECLRRWRERQRVEGRPVGSPEEDSEDAYSFDEGDE